MRIIQLKQHSDSWVCITWRLPRQKRQTRSQADQLELKKKRKRRTSEDVTMNTSAVLACSSTTSASGFSSPPRETSPCLVGYNNKGSRCQHAHFHSSTQRLRPPRFGSFLCACSVRIRTYLFSDDDDSPHGSAGHRADGHHPEERYGAIEGRLQRRVHENVDCTKLKG